MRDSVINRPEALMRDGQVRTLGQICAEVPDAFPTAVSAKLRQLRGRGYDLRSWAAPERGKGVWLYQVREKGQQELSFR